MTRREQPWLSYKKIATQTASPGQLVLMLYEGAVGFLEKSLRGFHHDDPLEFNRTINNNLLRAQAIISEMNYSLNMERGGELALHFRRLYNYMDDRLREANVKKQKEPIVEVIGRLQALRDSWAEMLRQRPEQTAAENPGEGLESSVA